MPPLVGNSDGAGHGGMWLALAVVTAVVLWVVVPFAVWNWLVDLQSAAQFGDVFGSVNALYSGLAFAGLAVTIYMQSQQTRLAREELRLQRTELGMQREEMAASRKELARQAALQRALFRASVAQIEVAAINA